MNAETKEKSVIELAPESYSRRNDLSAIPQTQAVTLVQALVTAAADPRTDMDKMERLYRMHREMLATEAEAAFHGAMARAQARMVPIVNNCKNTHTGSKYANLAAINSAIVPIYGAEGLSITFDSDNTEAAGMRRVIAIVAHAQGHSRTYHIDVPLDDAGAKGNVNKTAIQAIGSTDTYARRYLVRRIFNISTDDEDMDGNQEPKGGMSDQQHADFCAAVETIADAEGGKALWEKIVKVCHETKDIEAHGYFKAEITKKVNAFKAEGKQ
jgi:hypothetical protein